MKIGMSNLLTMKFLERDMHCPIHGNVKGKCIRYDNGEESRPECPMCEDEKAEREKAERQKVMDESKRRAFEEKMVLRNVKKEFWYKTLDDFRPQTPMQRRYLAGIKAMIERKRGKIIVLGSNGCGKTMLASEAVKALGGAIYTMFEISLQVRDCERNGDNGGMTEKEFVDYLISMPLLVIDELGRSKGSEFEQNLLSYVLDRRHSDDMPTIVLTNMHFKDKCKDGGCPKCFENFFDSDLLSRFGQEGMTIQLEDNIPDWRKTHKKGE